MSSSPSRRIVVLLVLFTTAGVDTLNVQQPRRVPTQPTHALAAAHHHTCSNIIMNADADEDEEPPPPTNKGSYDAMDDIQSFLAFEPYFKGFNASTPLGFAGATTTVCGIWFVFVEGVKFFDANPASPSVFGSLSTIGK